MQEIFKITKNLEIYIFIQKDQKKQNKIKYWKREKLEERKK